MSWLLDHFAVCTMVLLAVLSGTSNKVMQNLAPAYVQDELNTDPTHSAYVLAPAAIGMFVAMTLGPWLTGKFHERVSALIGFLSVATGLVMLGLVEQLTPLVAPWNPLQLIRLLGLDPSDEVLAAGLFSIPIGFGTTMTALSVQSYINHHVSADRQAGTFSIQSTLVNWFAIPPLLILGGLATAIGTGPVMFIIPAVMMFFAALLLWLGYHYTGRGKAPSAMRVLNAFIYEPESE
jgi:MFS family permease